MITRTASSPTGGTPATWRRSSSGNAWPASSQAPVKARSRSATAGPRTLTAGYRVGRPVPESPRRVQTAEPVVEHPDPHTLRRLLAQGLGKAMPDLVRSEDVILQMN